MIRVEMSDDDIEAVARIFSKYLTLRDIVLKTTNFYDFIEALSESVTVGGYTENSALRIAWRVMELKIIADGDNQPRPDTTREDIAKVKEIFLKNSPPVDWKNIDEEQLVSGFVDRVMNIYRAEMKAAEKYTGKINIMPVKGRASYVREALRDVDGLPDSIKDKIVARALKENWDYHEGG
ncbi:MAG: hypothetical protein QXU98_06655 [Candidatus Parvarchaeota archaeon]